MQVEVSKRAQRQWLRILVYYNEMGGEKAAVKLHQNIVIMPQSYEDFATFSV